MPAELITSARNARVQHVQHLMVSRKARNKHAEFFVEGVQAISAAVRNNWQISHLIYCPDAVRSDWAHKLIDSANVMNSLLLTKGDAASVPCGTKMPVIGTFTADHKACLSSWINSVIALP